MDTLKVDLRQLEEMSTGLLETKQKINNIYNEKILKIVNMSNDVLEKSSINRLEYIKKMNKLIEEVNNNIYSLYRVMNTQIIPGYQDMATSITSLFNKEFSDNMNNLMKEINNSNKE